jgi:multidrug efflux system outer membrane protein
VSFPLPWAGSHAPDLDAAHAAVAAQEARRKEATRVARLEIENACRALEQARQEVESFRSGRLAQSSELLEMARIGYDRGATSYLELLDAQHVYRTEQASYATALADYRIALADLQRAVGGQLP